MNIAVAGTGYVGLSISVLLAQHNKVKAVDIIPEKVELINQRKSPIQDEYIEKYLAEKELDLVATLDAESAYKDADFVVIAAPTNYDSQKNFFDTSAVESVIKLVMQYNPNAIMVIKSTIPVGFTAAVIVCPRTQNSFLPTMPMCRKTLLRLLWNPTGRARTLLPTAYFAWRVTTAMKKITITAKQRKRLLLSAYIGLR